MTERDEYTPSLDRARDLYSWACAWRTEDEEGEADLSELRARQRAEFDRMIEAVRQEEREKALREAADAVLHNAADPAYAGDPDEYARGYRQGIRDAARALRRAAEKGDES